MNAITAVIARRYEASQTPGSLIVFNQDQVALSVKSLELPWLNNIRRESCIPAGTYDCERLNHPRFGHCWHVKDVFERDEILIHSGNVASGKKVDTEGCIMPGLRYIDINNDGILDIVDSKLAMDQLRAILPDRFKLIIF